MPSTQYSQPNQFQGIALTDHVFRQETLEEYVVLGFAGFAEL
jgi:hypothetical protein